MPISAAADQAAGRAGRTGKERRLSDGDRVPARRPGGFSFGFAKNERATSTTTSWRICGGSGRGYLGLDARKIEAAIAEDELTEVGYGERGVEQSRAARQGAAAVGDRRGHRVACIRSARSASGAGEDDAADARPDALPKVETCRRPKSPKVRERGGRQPGGARRIHERGREHGQPMGARRAPADRRGAEAAARRQAERDRGSAVIGAPADDWIPEASPGMTGGCVRSSRGVSILHALHRVRFRHLPRCLRRAGHARDVLRRGD